MKFEISTFHNATIWNIYRMRDRIQLRPDYQRLSDIWPFDKRQLLIDSILNDFDIPKIYFHKFNNPLKKNGKSYDYAIIDGKQRLETLWAFIDGSIALDEDFEYFRNSSIEAGNMKYSELGTSYPDLKVQFDGFPLNIVCIETDELEMIEEMFSRLNESAPLSAPEKRNAFGGPLPAAIRTLASDDFFKNRLPFPNKRYRHYDLSTKFLLAESENKVVDTKKAYLDKFVKDHASKPRTKMPSFLETAQENVRLMSKVFTHKDPLLRQVGIVTLYYHLFRIARNEGWGSAITRKKLGDFEMVREENRQKAETDIGGANYDLIEFDRYAQSPNDAYAIKFRLSVLLREVFNKKITIENL